MNDTPLGYRAVRWLAKEVSETWFREHGAIETDRIPEGRGVLFAAWHPGSLIDPLVMISTLSSFHTPTQENVVPKSIPIAVFFGFSAQWIILCLLAKFSKADMRDFFVDE